MTTSNETSTTSSKTSIEHPILQLKRLNYVKVTGKILDSTDQKLTKYMKFATEQMGTGITSSDVIEYALNLLFDRDPGFKNWLKQKNGK